MAYFYVKNSLGTRTTGGGTTVQTGSFATLGAANVYAKIEDAITDGAGAGDYICCSDAHSYAAGAVNILYTGPNQSATATPASPLHIVSVSDTASNQRSVGAKEANTGAADFFPKGNIIYWGMEFECGDRWNNNVQGFQRFINCELILLTDYWLIQIDGSTTELINTNLDLRTDDCDFELRNACTFKMYGGKIYDSVGGTVDHVFMNSSGNGGMVIEMHGVDLSQINGWLLKGTGQVESADDLIQVTLTNCQLNGAMGYSDEALSSDNQFIKSTGCATTSAAAEYQYYLYTAIGYAYESSTIYRNNSTAFPSGQKISLYVGSSALAGPDRPFELVLPSSYVKLSDTASDKIRVHLAIAGGATLYDDDVYLKVAYPDGTNKHVTNFVQPADLDLDHTSVALTTSTEAWTGATGFSFYYLEVDTSVNAGADSVPVVTLCVTSSSTYLYVCPTFELS